MESKKACNILIVVISLVLIVLFWSTTYAGEETIAQRQADLKNVLETESLKVWRDYLEKYKPSREENDYTSLLPIIPDRLVMVPLKPDFVLMVQEMLAAMISPKPELNIGAEKILLVSYSLAYGESLWWGLFLNRPWIPPAEFKLDFKLRVYLLNATDVSLVAYPEHNYSGNTYKRDDGLKELFGKIQETLSGGTPNLQEMIERACKEIHRIAKVVDGEEAGLEENIRRQIAKVGIQDENWKFRQRAAQVLVGTLKPDDIEILSELLYDQEMDVRLAVVHGLSNKLTASVTVDTLGAALVPLFRLALLDESSYVRWYAAEGLGKTNSPEALESLFVALRDENVSVRVATVESLGQLGDPKATDVLIGLLQDKNSSVDSVAATSLEKLGWKPPDMRLQVKYLLAARKADDLAALGKPVTPLLIETLQSENIERVKIAARALGKIGDQSAAEAIQKALQTQKELDEVSLWMCYALVQFGVQRDEYIKLLIDAVSSDLGDTAAEVISKIDLTEEDIELICKTLVSPDPETRKRAVKILASVGNSAIADRLWKALAEEDDEGVRKVIREVLRNM